MREQADGVAGENLARNPSDAELPAGQELDALVAEHVMGYRWVPVDENAIAPPDCTHVLQGEWRGDPEGIQMCRQIAERYVARPTRYFSPTEYSTDILAAWSVLNTTILNHDWRWQIIEARGAHHVHLVPGYESRAVVLMADTTPLAICRAALRAVGVSSRDGEPTAPTTEPTP